MNSSLGVLVWNGQDLFNGHYNTDIISQLNSLQGIHTRVPRRPLPARLFIFPYNYKALASLTVRETALMACFLFPAYQIILRIGEKNRKTDP
ncbi:hypothetical protein ACVW06_000339 [Pantoea ananatis]